MCDRIGLYLIGGLLLSPLVFKIQLAPGLVIHPVVILLLLSWCWIAFVMVEPLRKSLRGLYVAEWQSWNIPMFLIGLLVGGLALSLTINNLQAGVFQSTGWLLLIKWSLYLAPLPLASLLAIRTGLQVVKVVSWLIPLTACATLLYSLYRLRHGIGLDLTQQYVGSSPEFQALGMLGEVWTREGLQVRTDTVSQGAYGMYLVLILLFSLLLALFRGWEGIVPVRYAIGQCAVLAPLAIMGILFTGSRASFLLMAGCLTILVGMVLVNPRGVVSSKAGRWFLFGLSATVCAILIGHTFWKPFIPTLDRVSETVQTAHKLTGDYAVSPEDQQAETRVVLRNLQTRFWLWEHVLHYLSTHPSAMLIGVGYDRQVFVERVLGLPYTKANVQFQTAHSLLLDILVKGGLVPFVALILLYAWLLWEAVLGMMIPRVIRQDPARIGLAWALLCFWPPFFGANLSGEEMFTDNLLLHWSLFAGLLLGLCAVALRQWLPGHIAHVTATAGLGGGPAYITALVKHQLSRGKKVRIFCSDEKPYVDLWRRMGIDVSALPMRRPNISSMWLLLKELLRAPVPMHAHGRGAAFFAVCVKILVRIPVIYQPHGPHYAFKRGYRYVSGWCFEAFCRLIFDAIIYVSEGERAMARRQRLPIGRSRVILSGLMQEPGIASADRAERDALLAALKIPTQKFVIGWIGRFQYPKGVDLLFDSIADVSARLPEAVWVIIGEGRAQEMAEYQEKSARLGIQNRVMFLGARPDAFTLIRAFDLYISTSRWEGLPLVLLEVMEQGVPIVASDVVGNRDVLEGWGALYPPNDASAAAAAQVRLASDAPLRQRLAAAGREVRLKRFSLSRMLAEIDRTYVEILGEAIAGEGGQ
ncbi:MAG: glycosyltransferase [Thermomicrobiales bacterium]|nr:glycosyltransferase [Nitrospira sp. CR2.1]TXG85815.1 MAG: glycosyltransferase [Thermomicrobiales bacterium]